MTSKTTFFFVSETPKRAGRNWEKRRNHEPVLTHFGALELLSGVRPWPFVSYEIVELLSHMVGDFWKVFLRRQVQKKCQEQLNSTRQLSSEDGI